MDCLLHVRRNFTGGIEKLPKGKRVRSVPMMPDVIDRLANLKYRERFADADDLVFTREGEHTNHFDLRRDDAAKLAEAFEVEDNDPVDLPEKEEA